MEKYVNFDPQEHIKRIIDKGIVTAEMMGGAYDEKRKFEDDSEVNDVGRRELRQMFMIIEDLHRETKKFWTTFVYWFQRRRTLLNQKFKVVDLKKALKTCVKVKKYLQEPQLDPDNDDFGRYAKGIRSGIMEQILDMEAQVEKFKVLKSDIVHPKHEEDIRKMLELKDANFTFQQLIDSPWDKHRQRIEELLYQGRNDAKFEEMVNSLMDCWEKEQLTFKVYKDTFTINKEDMLDLINYKLDEYQIAAERITKRVDLSAFFK